MMSSTKIQLTNLQMIETLVKSQASINPSLSSSKAPKYIIVGTFEDKANKCGETIETKNVGNTEGKAIWVGGPAVSTMATPLFSLSTQSIQM